GTRLPCGILGSRSNGIPGTDFLADVTAIHMSADAFKQRTGNRATELDSQVRHASRRIEYSWGHEGLSRACLETQRARAALIQRRHVHLERQAADDLTQKEPGAGSRTDHARVLANPADPGMAGVHALLHRAGVDIDACVELSGRSVSHPGH